MASFHLKMLKCADVHSCVSSSIMISVVVEGFFSQLQPHLTLDELVRPDSQLSQFCHM